MSRADAWGWQGGRDLATCNANTLRSGNSLEQESGIARAKFAPRTHPAILANIPLSGGSDLEGLSLASGDNVQAPKQPFGCVWGRSCVLSQPDELTGQQRRQKQQHRHQTKTIYSADSTASNKEPKQQQQQHASPFQLGASAHNRATSNYSWLIRESSSFGPIQIGRTQSTNPREKPPQTIAANGDCSPLPLVCRASSSATLEDKQTIGDEINDFHFEAGCELMKSGQHMIPSWLDTHNLTKTNRTNLFDGFDWLEANTSGGHADRCDQADLLSLSLLEAYLLVDLESRTLKHRLLDYDGRLYVNDPLYAVGGVDGALSSVSWGPSKSSRRNKVRGVNMDAALLWSPASFGSFNCKAELRDDHRHKLNRQFESMLERYLFATRQHIEHEQASTSLGNERDSDCVSAELRNLTSTRPVWCGPHEDAGRRRRQELRVSGKAVTRLLSREQTDSTTAGEHTNSDLQRLEHNKRNSNSSSSNNNNNHNESSRKLAHQITSSTTSNSGQFYVNCIGKRETDQRCNNVSQMNQVARVIQRSSPTASPMVATVATTCQVPHHLASEVIQQDHHPNQGVVVSDSLGFVGDDGSVVSNQSRQLIGADGDCCYRDWPLAMRFGPGELPPSRTSINSAASLESLDFKSYQIEDRACVPILQQHVPISSQARNIFEHLAEDETMAAHARASFSSSLTFDGNQLAQQQQPHPVRPDLYRVGGTAATLTVLGQHENETGNVDESNNNNRQQDCCLPRQAKYKWHNGTTESVATPLLTSSELAYGSAHRLPPYDRHDFGNPFTCSPSVAVTDEHHHNQNHLPRQRQQQQQRHNNNRLMRSPSPMQHAASIETSQLLGSCLFQESDSARILLTNATELRNCSCLECRQQQQQQFESSQIGAACLVGVQDNVENELCVSSNRRPLAIFARPIALNEATGAGGQWRSHSTMSIPGDLYGFPEAARVNGVSLMPMMLSNERPYQHHHGRMYTPPPIATDPAQCPTARNAPHRDDDNCQPVTTSHQHQLGAPVPSLSRHHRPPLPPRRPSLNQMGPTEQVDYQPYQPMSMVSRQHQFQQVAPWSLPSSPVVGGGIVQSQPNHYCNNVHSQNRSNSSTTANQQRFVQANYQPHLHRSSRGHRGHNKEHKHQDNVEPVSAWSLSGASAGARAAGPAVAADRCRQQISIDNLDPARHSQEFYYPVGQQQQQQQQQQIETAGQRNDADWLYDDEWTEDEEEEEAETLALVPSQAKGRLPMSVAEQMSEQATKFVQHHPSASVSAPGSSGPLVSRVPVSRHNRSTGSASGVELNQIHHQQPATSNQFAHQHYSSRQRSRSLAGHSKLNDRAGAKSNNTNNLQVRRTLRVKVRKSKPILGIAIEGGFNVSGQLIPRIVCVHEKGAAYQCGKLRASDLILEVNGISTVNMTHDQIAETIANAYYQDERPYIEFLIGESVHV